MNEVPYFKFGNGKKNLVIIPGLSIKPLIPSRIFIEDKFSILKEDYTIYFFDRIDNPKVGYTIFDMAKDTLYKMHELGIEQTDIYGTSQGGMIALAITKLEPDIVNKVVLASTYSRGNPFSVNTFNEWIKLSKQRDEKALIDSVIHHVYSKDMIDKYYDALYFGMKNITEEQYQRFTILGDACLTFDMFDDLKDIHKDMWVVASENDNVLLSIGSKEIADITGAKFELYNQYGHALYDEDPNFVKKLYDFFRK